LPELELGNVENYYGRDLMLNISLPNQIIDFIERQSIADGFSTPSQYVFALILREQERVTQTERVESLLSNRIKPDRSRVNVWNLEPVHRQNHRYLQFRSIVKLLINYCYLELI
jgi:hypothetical protein